MAIAVFVAVFTACSSSSKSSQSSPSTTVAAAPTTVAPAACTPPKAGGPVTATRVNGIASDWTLTSFDGTQIRMHWFPAPTATAAHPEPTVLMGPGWGESGDTDTKTVGLFGSLGIGALNKAGYNVLTWDPRGFGKSTGTVEIDSADYEGRDVEKMLDWVSTRPGVQLDAKDDPRVGMAGGSYGGGIQLITAAIDCRVDAIVPMIAWNSLKTSLSKADTPKNGWSGLLMAATQGRSIDPHIRSAYQSSITTAVIDPADQEFFADRGPGDLINDIKIPTLIVQGTVDNLFTLDEGIANYRMLRDRNVPTAMLWFCGGHGVCLTNPGDQTRVGRATMAWLNRYVNRDTKIDTGPRFDFIDQNGTRYTADDYPLPTRAPLAVSGTGSLQLLADGGSGPAHPATGSKDPLAGIAGAITPAKATNAVNVTITATEPAVIVGAPQLVLSYSGTTPAGVKPTRVFAQLVDPTTGLVVGNQTTPIDVTLDGKTHQVTVPLEVIAFTAHTGARLTLQLVATTVEYAQPRLGGTINFDRIDLSLPVAADLSAK